MALPAPGVTGELGIVGSEFGPMDRECEAANVVWGAGFGGVAGALCRFADARCTVAELDGAGWGVAEFGAAGSVVGLAEVSAFDGTGREAIGAPRPARGATLRWTVGVGRGEDGAEGCGARCTGAPSGPGELGELGVGRSVGVVWEVVVALSGVDCCRCTGEGGVGRAVLEEVVLGGRSVGAAYEEAGALLGVACCWTGGAVPGEGGVGRGELARDVGAEGWGARCTGVPSGPGELGELGVGRSVGVVWEVVVALSEMDCRWRGGCVLGEEAAGRGELEEGLGAGPCEDAGELPGVACCRWTGRGVAVAGSVCRASEVASLGMLLEGVVRCGVALGTAACLRCTGAGVVLPGAALSDAGAGAGL
nr:hypothetical protein OH837_47685 [Streptomyces canus]